LWARRLTWRRSRRPLPDRIGRYRILQRLGAGGYQFVGCSRHVKPGRELPENPAVGLGQFQQDFHQFRFVSPG
jgi:hypothetical protein